MSAPVMDLHCRVDGAGRDLVLLHPAGLDHASMQAVAVAAARSHRVLSIDLRGHGLSPDAQVGSRLEEWAEDIRAAIVRHCNGPAVILGVSLGGMLAQTLAYRHPDVVCGLVLCACTATFDAPLREVLRERGQAAERGGMAAVVDATLDRWFTAEARKGPAAMIVRERLLNDQVSNWVATWHAIALHDALPRLADLAVPTLVIAGECDAATPLAATRRLADAIPGARWLCLPGAPHMMQIECSENFNTAVRQFLDEIEPHGVPPTQG